MAIVTTSMEAYDEQLVSMSETASDITDVELMQYKIDTTVNTALALEQLHITSMKTSIAGLSPSSAALIRINMESLSARLGVNIQRPVPALEAFSSIHSRVHATNIAIEGLGSFLSDIWVAILKAMQVMYERISSFFTRVNDSAIKAHNTSVVTDIRASMSELNKQNISTHETVVDFIADFGLLSIFYIPGKGPTHETVIQILENTIDFSVKLEKFMKHYSTYLDGVYSNISVYKNVLRHKSSLETSALASLANSTTITNHREELNKAIETIFDKITSHTDREALKNAEAVLHGSREIRTSGYLAGGKQVLFVLKEDNKDKLHYVPVTADPMIHDDVTTFKTFEYLTVSEMEKVTDLYESLTTHRTSTFAHARDEHKRQSEKILKEIEEIRRLVTTIYTVSMKDVAKIEVVNRAINTNIKECLSNFGVVFYNGCSLIDVAARGAERLMSLSIKHWKRQLPTKDAA